jgi:crotonobetainyl-CoA:carnitine CoA-transferase CaiB-like acyl-CoA transferase
MGQTGPYRHFRGYGAQMEDLMGHAWLRSYEDGTLSTVAVPSDAAAGAGAALAFMAALHHREPTGAGQFVDLSLAENFLPYLGEALLDYAMNGRVRRGLGNRSSHLAPQGAYLCAPEDQGADDWIAISVQSDAIWQSLCRLMDRPDLAADPALRHAAGRVAQHDRLDAAIASWVRRFRQREAQDLLQAAGIAAGAVLDEPTAFHDPQLRARGFFQTITGPDTGTHEYPVRFFHPSGAPQAARRPPVRFGEDNAYVYHDLLGYSATKIQRLAAGGHIGTDYVPEIP